MKLGRVGVKLFYVVDLENGDMVSEAIECVYEDMMNAVKYDELGSYIGIIEENTPISEEDIPEFLKGEEEEY